MFILESIVSLRLLIKRFYNMNKIWLLQQKLNFILLIEHFDFALFFKTCSFKLLTVILTRKFISWKNLVQVYHWDHLKTIYLYFFVHYNFLKSSFCTIFYTFCDYINVFFPVFRLYSTWKWNIYQLYNCE